MWLADDDRLDAGYVSACLQPLIGHDDVALAYGRMAYACAGDQEKEVAPTALLAANPAWRVFRYFLRVDDNGAMYGLMPRALMASLPPMRNDFGDDWLLIASVAAQGKFVAVQDGTVYRNTEGLSRNFSDLTRHYGLSGRIARNPYNRLARVIFREIGWQSRAYEVLPSPVRLLLAAACALTIALRYNARVWSAGVASAPPWLKSPLKSVRSLVRRLR
jgi:hypothetical protein